MTELEQYKKAYATLVGRVDTTITKLETVPVGMPAGFTAAELRRALEEAEEIFLATEEMFLPGPVEEL